MPPVLKSIKEGNLIYIAQIPPQLITLGLGNFCAYKTYWGLNPSTSRISLCGGFCSNISSTVSNKICSLKKKRTISYEEEKND